MLSQTEVESLVADGDIDTVIVAFCDMQGRLTGKRVSARLFVEGCRAHGAGQASAPEFGITARSRFTPG